MTLELANTIASVASLVILATAAIAALGQLRHVRASNQIAALVECRQTLASPEFAQARQFLKRRLPEILRDPANYARLTESPLDQELMPLNTIGNFLETLGVFVKYRIVDRRVACDVWGGVVVECWNNMAPALGIVRSVHGTDVWENFEYLAWLSRTWMDAHPNGTFPKQPNTSRHHLQPPSPRFRLPSSPAKN